MKKIIVYVLCAVMAVSLVGCATTPDSSGKSEGEKEGGTQLANPFVDCETLTDAAKLSGFEITLPSAMPQGYSQDAIRAVKDDMLEIIYKNADSSITLRKAKGSEDVSGDYTQYPETQALEIDKVTVNTKGDKGLVNVAIWTQGEFSFSASFDVPQDKETVTELVGQIK
ncbi:MAG: hypothetical protein RR846_04140 [Oscillospiraceae bacterium]